MTGRQDEGDGKTIATARPLWAHQMMATIARAERIVMFVAELVCYVPLHDDARDDVRGMLDMDKVERTGTIRNEG